MSIDSKKASSQPTYGARPVRATPNLSAGTVVFNAKTLKPGPKTSVLSIHETMNNCLDEALGSAGHAAKGTATHNVCAHPDKETHNACQTLLASTNVCPAVCTMSAHIAVHK